MIASKSLRHPFSRANKKGQTLVEYALVISIVSVVAIATMENLTGQTKVAYSTIDAQLTDAQNGSASAPARTH